MLSGESNSTLHYMPMPIGEVACMNDFTNSRREVGVGDLTGYSLH